MRTFDNDEEPRKRIPALKICATLGLTAVLTLWLAQNSINTYWQEHYFRASPLAWLDSFALWRAGGVLQERCAGWYAGLFQSNGAKAGAEAEASRSVRLAAEALGRQTARPLCRWQGDKPSPQTSWLLGDCREPVAVRLPLRATPQPEPALAASTRPPLMLANRLAAPTDTRSLTLTAEHEVFFAGDSMMEGIAPHVALWLKKHGIQSTNRSRFSTGLAYPNPKTRDWPQEIENALAANPRIKLIVVFLGPNDPWDMPNPEKKGGRFLRFRSPEWESVYRSRISRILTAAESRGARVIWLGLPYMRKPTFNQQMLYLDEVMRAETGQRGIFIPTKHLLSAAGAYADSIPLNGKTVSVRAKDGVHFTPAGQRILAQAIQAKIRVPGAAPQPPPATAATAPARTTRTPPQLARPATTLRAGIVPEAQAAPSESLPSVQPAAAGPALTLQAHHEVLFAGDSLMEGVAPHVAFWLKKQGIKSTNRSRFSTGLTHPNPKTRDWPQEIETTLETNPNLKLIVIFLGPNDPMDIPNPESKGKYHYFRTPGWETIYRSRVSRILNAAERHGAHVIWLGLPYMRKPAYNKNMSYISEVIRSEVQGRAIFLPTKDLLSNTGAYTDAMTINGKTVGLRARDGVHFTPAGQRIIAQAVQAKIRVIQNESHNARR